MWASLAALWIAWAGLSEAQRAHAAEAPAGGAEALYAEHCASCHGERRYGGYAPPLIPSTLSRKSDEELATAIAEGLPNTQMPAFAEKLDATAALGLVALLREPVGTLTWSLEDIAASRVEEPVTAGAIPAGISRENLVLVVERGTGQVVVLDGDTLDEVVAQMTTKLRQRLDHTVDPRRTRRRRASNPTPTLHTEATSNDRADTRRAG